MTLKLDITMKGNAKKVLNNIARGIKPAIKKTLIQYGEESRHKTRRRITIEKRDPLGRSWAAWAPRTLQYRLGKGNVHLGLLYDTGDLWRSVQYKVKGDTLYLGSDIEYARHLQYGTSIMPSRQIVNFNTRETRTRIRQLLKKNIGLM